MRQRLILNDLHIGVDRVTGTTPATAFQLRDYLLTKTREVMLQHTDKDIIFNGDIFDRLDVSPRDVLAFSRICEEWMSLAGDGIIYMGRGNHDIAKDSTKLSMFDFIGHILSDRYNKGVQVVTSSQFLDEEQTIYMIPHCPNQDLFNLELSKAFEMDMTERATRPYLLLHANFDNNFAVESDHSLNVSRDQAQGLIDQGWTLIFGHEHQARHEMGGRVICTGNQFPSSVADCLNNPNNAKYAHIIDSAGALVPVEVWKCEGSFKILDWSDLGTADVVGAQFVRVEGHATADQASDVISAVSKFRQKTNAFVVTNATRVEGIADMDELQISADEIKQFDVLEALYEYLGEEFADMVRTLMEQKMKEAA